MYQPIRSLQLGCWSGELQVHQHLNNLKVQTEFFTRPQHPQHTRSLTQWVECRPLWFVLKFLMKYCLGWYGREWSHVKHAPAVMVWSVGSAKELMSMNCCNLFARRDPVFREESHSLNLCTERVRYGLVRWVKTSLAKHVNVPNRSFASNNVAVHTQSPQIKTAGYLGDARQTWTDYPATMWNNEAAVSIHGDLSRCHTCWQFQKSWWAGRYGHGKSCQQLQGQALHYLGQRISPWEAGLN